jgi:ArsR family transcriptional regulator
VNLGRRHESKLYGADRNQGLPSCPLLDNSRTMKATAAVSALSALAHESRLHAFRLLVQASPKGISAGEIATQLGIAPPTLSFHLAHLVRAGLIDSQREGRSVVYTLRVGGIRELLGFITEDCCQGRPELCAASTTSAQDCEPCGS